MLSGSQVAEFVGLTAQDWAALIQAAAIVVGALWAVYLYRSGRKSEARVGINHDERIVAGVTPLLLISLRISNESAVLFTYEIATCTLMDASRRSPDGEVTLIPFAEQDPFVPVYWEMTEDADEVVAGRLFADPPVGASLEPAEAVETELAFPLRSTNPGLMAVRVMIRGRQGRFRPSAWDWGAFWYVDPVELLRDDSKTSTPADPSADTIEAP